MEEKNQTNQPTPAPVAAPTPSAAPASGATQSPPSAAAAMPQTPPPTTPTPIKLPSDGKKNSGLLLVAAILVVLIVVLGALYYIIINQGSKTTPKPTYTKPQVPNTVAAPTTVPTVTPTDEEILNSQIQDPATDATELNQAAQGL